MSDPKPLRGVAAVHIFAGRAALKGYVPLVTARNTEGFDVALVNPQTKKNVNIQVKANSSGTDYWFVGQKIAEYLFVLAKIEGIEGECIFYFVPSKIINAKKRSDRTKKGTTPSYRYVREEDVRKYKERWEFLEKSSH